MGMLVDGVWQDTWYQTKNSNGKFRRESAQFRNWITADGAAGPSGGDGFKAEADRYHLYISLACPWAHRTLIFRKLKGLENLIGLTVVHPHMLENGWEFDLETGGDPLGGHSFVYQVYTSVVPDYTGRVTVPILWDRKRKTVVSNESSEIIRMLNSAFDHLTGNTLDFYPAELRSEIDEVNDFVYPNINNGVYRAGFATTQSAYEEAFDALFSALDKIEERLSTHRYLVGERLTEADWRLFTTLIRFDAVYYGHFKTNLRHIEDYPNISGYLRELYQYPGVAETVSFEHIKSHYYVSQTTINPTQVVPKGPVLDYSRPHKRAG
ncbi:glutathione S-transferase family protein [Flexibacterium corallicola]|uniref:glutathione S-transferase family protein n=1 Tax=Flexibacterium corallicola TaxID=3037259 RepID=UPI00286EB6FA|nr:glutathione S-transferase family protein [Pseudovibrio sp. M1P-2-3]